MAETRLTPTWHNRPKCWIYWIPTRLHKLKKTESPFTVTNIATKAEELHSSFLVTDTVGKVGILSSILATFCWNIYCPQRSCEGYVFTGICLSTEGAWGVCLSAFWDTTPTPPGADTLQWWQTPPQHRLSPEADIPPQKQTPLPRSRHPPRADTPQKQTPPRSRHPPRADTPQKQTPPEADTPPRADPPPRDMATAADGTHPTGMHSCFI